MFHNPCFTTKAIGRKKPPKPRPFQKAESVGQAEPVRQTLPAPMAEPVRQTLPAPRALPAPRQFGLNAKTVFIQDGLCYHNWLY